MIIHKKTFIIGLFLIISVSVFATTAYEEKLVRADSYRLFTDNGFSFQYTLTDGENSSVMRVYLKGTDVKSVLSKYLSPLKLSSRRIFMEGSNFWMIDRNMRDPIRISSSQMLFGQASAGDITRLSFSDNYNIDSGELLSDRTILQLSAKVNAKVSYKFVRLELRNDDSRPIKVDLYASKGTLMKTILYEKYGRINGKVLLVGFRIINSLKNAESFVELSNFSSKTLDNRYFSREGMKSIP